MKNILSIILLILCLNIQAQVCTTAVVYDYIETYTWTSGWSTGSKGGYYTNTSVSGTTSAALIGNGNGSSPIEDGYYILTNTTGLISTNTYYLEFRLGSYKFGGPSAATAGADVGDYVDVQYSSNGGASYVSELRVTGNAGALWSYASTAVASKTASGALTTFTPAGGGDRTSTGDGYSIIRLTLTAGSTQAAFRIYCRANSDGEEWWMDDFILYTIGPCTPLPIELINFELTNDDDNVLVEWATASEQNNSHYNIQRSNDGIIWQTVGVVNAVGNSVITNEYKYLDKNLSQGTYYYRLQQVDFSGDMTYSDIQVIQINENTCLYYNLNGVVIDIDKAPTGMYINKCGNKIFKVFKN